MVIRRMFGEVAVPAASGIEPNQKRMMQIDNKAVIFFITIIWMEFLTFSGNGFRFTGKCWP